MDRVCFVGIQANEDEQEIALWTELEQEGSVCMQVWAANSFQRKRVMSRVIEGPNIVYTLLRKHDIFIADKFKEGYCSFTLERTSVVICEYSIRVENLLNILGNGCFYLKPSPDKKVCVLEWDPEPHAMDCVRDSTFFKRVKSYNEILGVCVNPASIQEPGRFAVEVSFLSANAKSAIRSMSMDQLDKLLLEFHGCRWFKWSNNMAILSLYFPSEEWAEECCKIVNRFKEPSYMSEGRKYLSRLRPILLQFPLYPSSH